LYRVKNGAWVVLETVK